MSAAPCPPAEDLVELAEGGLSGEDAAAVHRHVRGCEECRAVLAGLAPVLTPEEAAESLASTREGGQARLRLPDVKAGQQLGRHTLEKLIGAGAMGAVWAAFDPQLGRRVALKLLRPGAGGEADEAARRDRLLREAQAMARLSHPNVVVVHDVGVVGSTVYVVMEHVEGATLQRWLHEKKRGPAEILRAFAEAGRGLAAAHESGLVHRDFKPDNVLVDLTGRVRVTDFGLARSSGEVSEGRLDFAAPLGDLTRSGAIVGTPAYMAPEQLSGVPASAASDIFAFCVALWEALYGTRPFGGSSLGALRESLLRGPPKIPARPRVPSEVRSILTRGLAPDPKDRPASMAEVLAALAHTERTRAVGLAAAAALVIAVAGFAWFDHKGRICQGAERDLYGAWDGPKRAAVEKAFATGEPWAAEALAATTAALDRYSAAWVRMRTQACEATRVRREQPEALLQLRLSCLDRRVDELRALTGLLASADEKLRKNASRAASSLSALSTCADAETLTAAVPLPPSAAERAQIEQLRVALAKNRALKLAGRYREGQAGAAELAAKAKATSYAPLQAEALFDWGLFLEAEGDYPRAEGTLRDGLFSAEAGREGKRAVRAWAELVWVDHQLGKADEGLIAAKHARSLLGGLGGDAELEGLIASNEGALLIDAGRFTEAAERFRESVQRRQTALGPDDHQVGIATVNLAVALARQDDHQGALALQQKALEIYRRSLGPRHPLYAQTLFNIAASEQELNQLPAARTHAETARKLLEELLGPAHPLVASAENVLGLVAQAEGRSAEAQEHLTRAIAISEKARGKDHPFTGHYAAALGDTLEAQGRHAAALALYRRAIAIYELAKDEQSLSRVSFAMAEPLVALGKKDEARAGLERALKIEEAATGAGWNESRKADVRLSLSRLLHPRDRARAVELAGAALQAYRKLSPQPAGKVADAGKALAVLGVSEASPPPPPAPSGPAR